MMSGGPGIGNSGPIIFGTLSSDLFRRAKPVAQIDDLRVFPQGLDPTVHARL